ncbi:MAG: type IV secretion protein Rhs, partial [Clostridiaceae bacterium]|nr:type IV secretion protein Rhs [Clostridiaceae bacterium]
MPLLDSQSSESKDASVSRTTLPNVKESPQSNTVVFSATGDSGMETSINSELLSVTEETYSSYEVEINEIEPVKVKINEIEPVVLAAGGNHSLHVKNDGTVWAWGDNTYGQLGDGTTTNSTIAVQVMNVDYDFKNARLKVNTTTGKDGTGFSGELFNLDVGKGEKEGNFGIRPSKEANVSIDIVYNDVTLKWELESMDIKMENGVTIKLEFKYSVPLDAYFGGMLLSGYAYVEIEGGINFIVEVSIPDVSKLDSLEDLIAKIEANVWLSVKGAIGAEVGYGLLSGDLFVKGLLDINIPSLRTTLTLSFGYDYGYLWFFSEEEYFEEPKTWILYNGIKQKNLLRMLSNYSSTETGLTSEGEENNGEIIFKSAPRDYLENQKWIGKDEIIHDAYPDSDAQIAAIDKELGDLIMVFIGDDSDRSDNNRTTISSSIYKDGTWSEPIQIEDDGTGDAFPDIAADGKDIYASWLDMTEEIGEIESSSEDDITKNVLCKMGITVAQYNAATNSWNKVLTNKTEGANKLPKIAAKNGKVLATWVNNRDGKAIGNKLSPDNLYYVYNNGAGWTEPKAFLTDVSNVYESDLYLSGDKAYYVFVTDAYSEDGLYKLYVTSFDGENWSVPKEVLDNMYQDSHPSIAVENNEPVVFWQNNKVIYKSSLKTPDKAQIVVNSEQAEDILELSAANTDEGIALAWTKAKAGEQRVYVSTYEESSSTWTPGMEINMNSMEIPKNLALAGLEDSVMVVYNKNIYKLNEDNAYYKDSTSLTSTIYVRKVDLAISKDGLYFEDGSPMPGDSATVIAAVENVGDLSTKGMKVSLYEGEKLIDQKELPDLQLSNGDKKLVSFDWVVPGNYTGFTLRAVVESNSDSNTSNNTAQLEQSYTDLEITGVYNELYTKNTGFVYVDVKNIGYSSIKNAKVFLATDKEFKDIISTKEIDNLDIFSEKRVVFDLEASDEQISSRARIYAKVEVEQSEINNFNNSDFTVIRPCEVYFGVVNPGTEEPGTGEPGTGEPGTGEPGTGEPGTGEPGTGEP